MSKIVIYTAKDGNIQLDVSLANNTVWLSQQQIADLFGTKRQAITKHLKNIYISGELEENSVCSILEHTAKDGKTYQTKFYSLDAIISIGYRVNSNQATQFRIWATQVLKEHLIEGHTVYKPRLAQRGLHALEQTVELLQKTLKHHALVNDLGSEAIQIILSYAKTWNLLLAYDEARLEFPQKSSMAGEPKLSYLSASSAIGSLKSNLMARKEATSFFGQERNPGQLKGILAGIEQTFDGKALYKSIEEKAAHLLYFIIKNHPFIDGNKRIGSFIFLLYLQMHNVPINLNENGLVALALLIAESNSVQKEVMTCLIANILVD